MTDRPGETGGEGAAGWNWNPSNGGDWTPPTEQQAGHGWAPGPPPPAAPRPGVVPLRPLSFGEVLDGAFTMIQRYPAILLGFSAAVYAVVAVLLYFWSASIGLDAALAPLEQIDRLDQTDQLDALTSAGAAASWFSLGSGLLNWLASGIVTGVITITAARGILGRQVTIAETWRAFRPRLPRLLGLTILIALIIIGVMVAWLVLLFVSALTGSVVITGLIAALGGIGMLVVMIFLGVRLALAPAALVLETHTGVPGSPISPTATSIPPDLGSAAGAAAAQHRRPTRVLEAIRRSWRLVRGRSWRTFGILLVAVLIAAVVAGILEYAVTLLGGLIADLLSSESSGAGTALAGGIGFVSSGVLQAAVIAAVSVLVYVDARMRTEGLDIMLSATLPPPTGAHPGVQPGIQAGPGSGWGPGGPETIGQQHGTEDPESPWSVP